MFRLMVLGGGSSQLNLIQRARQEGITVIVADQNPAAPACRWADRVVPVSTFDHEGVARAAAAEHVDAIVAVGTDQPVYSAAVASAKLSLPFVISPETALLVTNKRHMKTALHAHGIPTAPFLLVAAGSDARVEDHFAGPYVVKPIDSQGQRGIALVADSAGVHAHIPEALRYSRASEVIVEKYYPSQEVTVSGWVERSRPRVFAVTDRVTIADGSSIGVCVAHRYPNCHDAATNATILALTAQIVTALGIEAGPIYFQMLVGADGVVVNEVACRLGGAYEDVSLPPICGVDLLGLQLTAAGRQTVADHVLPRTAGAVAVPLVFCRPGRVERFGPAAVLHAVAGVAAAGYLLDAPVRIEPLRNSTQRAAFGVIHGQDPAETNARLRAWWPWLTALNADGRNLIRDTLSATLIAEPGIP